MNFESGEISFSVDSTKPAFPEGITQDDVIKQIKAMGNYITTNENEEECYVIGNLLFKINKEGEVLGTILE